MNLLEAIESRLSVRTFTGQALDGGQRALLLESLALKGPFGTVPRTVLLDAASVEGDKAAGADGESKGARIGTYGIVKKPAAYLAAIVGAGGSSTPDAPESDRPLFDLGFVVEGFVLEATRLGLGTCWLGGTFDKGGAAAAAGIVPGEALRALIAVGTPATKRALLDRFIRSAAGSADRRPVEALVRERGTNGKDGGLLADPAVARIVEAVRRTPSASNKQPWRLAIGRGEGSAVLMDLHLERAPRYEKLAGYGIQALDGGIAACHAELAAVELGFAAERRTEAMEGPSPWEGSAFMLGWTLTRR